MNKELEVKLKKTADRLGLTLDQMPRHIAIIMDGNGRWAQQKGLPRVQGHNKGGQVVVGDRLRGVERVDGLRDP